MSKPKWKLSCLQQVVHRLTTTTIEKHITNSSVAVVATPNKNLSQLW